MVSDRGLGRDPSTCPACSSCGEGAGPGGGGSEDDGREGASQDSSRPERKSEGLGRSDRVARTTKPLGPASGHAGRQRGLDPCGPGSVAGHGSAAVHQSQAGELLSKAPKHCHEELKRDYHSITYAEDLEEAATAYESFCRKWGKLVPEVEISLKEAGKDLLSFYKFPRETWKNLRTTNMIERLNEEFRRRIRTQGSFPDGGRGADPALRAHCIRCGPSSQN